MTLREIRDILNTLPDEVLNMDGLVGTDTGIVRIRSFAEITDATDVDDLDGNTRIFETSPTI